VSQESIELFHRITEAANAPAMAEQALGPLLAPDYRIENIVTAVTDKTYYGVAGCLEWFDEMSEAFAAGARYEAEAIIADGEDFVVGRMAFVGTGARSAAHCACAGSP
jgi:hypothetical protein